MHVRSVRAVAIVSIAVVAAVTAHTLWRTAGQEKVRAATERVAGAVARSDREVLANDALLRDHAGNVDWLLKYSPDLADGYQVRVGRNGADGYTLMSLDTVTHLGIVQTPSGTLTLGFRYDRGAGRLEFVTASFSTRPS